MRYYLDTEFDGFGGRLMSLALVREDGESVYYVMPYEAQDPWVIANVIPILFDCPPGVGGGPARTLTVPKVAAMGVAEFLHGDPDPVIVTDWPADIRYFCEMIEFPMGTMAPIPSLKFELQRVDAYPTTLTGAVQHNAWWDSMALRHLIQGAEA